jgi:peptidoglycan/xylan/chitin deacetylase (PgdA/CDA1 family)
MPRSLSVSLRVIPLAALTVLTLEVGCSSHPPAGAAAPSAHANGGGEAAMEIGFTEQPTYVPNDTLALTFDDGPLAPFTGEILDILKKDGVHATFFINTQNNGNDVDRSPVTQELVRRIVSEGHGLANHTVHHLSLKTLDAAAIDAEVVGVESTTREILHDPSLRLTLVRAPYGEPYQDYFYDRADPAGAAYPLVSRVLSKHGVHVGWNVETDDWKCTTGDPAANADCVYEHFTTAVKTVGAPGAQWGVVLMHCVNPQTVAALPRILDYVRANRFKLVSVEDVVRMKFAKSSAELVGR